MKVTALMVCAAIACAATALVAQEKKTGAPAKKAAPTDDAVIKKAMSGGPAGIAKDATIVAMSDDMKSSRTLRKGTNGYTCLMDGPDPMCADENAMAWFDAYMNKK